jgi:hypothetical protein
MPSKRRSCSWSSGVKQQYSAAAFALRKERAWQQQDYFLAVQKALGSNSQPAPSMLSQQLLQQQQTTVETHSIALGGALHTHQQLASVA